MTLTEINELKRMPTTMLEHAADHNQLQFDAYLKRFGHRDPLKLGASQRAADLHASLELHSWVLSEIVVRDLLKRHAAV